MLPASAQYVTHRGEHPKACTPQLTGCSKAEDKRGATDLNAPASFAMSSPRGFATRVGCQGKTSCCTFQYITLFLCAAEENAILFAENCQK